MKDRICWMDKETGEMFTPILVSGRKTITKLYGQNFFLCNQTILELIENDRELTHQPIRVLIHLLRKMDFGNYIDIHQETVAKSLKISPSNVSKVIKLLVEKGILIRDPNIRQRFRLNPNYGFKGNPHGQVYMAKAGELKFT